jgi:AcrR family transcriptional regulator
MTAPTRRPGRRPGPSSSRDDILAAARVLFGERGYDKASIRAIAREAGVDPALVHHFFGSKEELFVAAMELPVDPTVFLGQVLTGPRSELGERMARTFLRIWSDPRLRPQFIGVFRSAATTEQGAALLREFITRAILARVADTLGDVPTLNLAAAAAQMIGIAMFKYIVQIEPLASATEDDLVALLAPTLQRYFEG